MKAGKNRLQFLRDEIDKLKAESTFTTLPILSTPQGPKIKVNGKNVLNLSSNNYLGFANHPRLSAAAKKAMDKWGFGAGAVRQIAGTMEIHDEAEEMLAKFKRTEASLIFVAGIAANRGTIPAIMDEGDVIISDELNHGSIIDGVRLTKSERKVYPHLDMEGLEKALVESRNARRRLVVTDGVFSMNGDMAPLDQMADLCDKYDAMLMVDDAHGDGVLGKDGRGIVDHFNLHGRVDIDMGTLSKAFGCIGGYIAGRQELRDYLINRARSFIFTTAHPPCVIAAIMEALRMVQDEPQHLKRLWENTKLFKEGLRDLGFDIGHSQTPITPVMVGESAKAQKLSKSLFENGVFAKPIVYPLVSKDTARIRNIVTAEHTIDDLGAALDVYAKVGREMKLI
jgi:glycine C-acetyltransferase